MQLNYELFISTFLLIFLAELPDKTAFAAVLLAARGRALPVFVGVASAFVVQTLVAVVFGSLLAHLPPRWVHLGAGLLFFVFALQSWRHSNEPGAPAHADGAAPPRGFLRLTWQAFMVIFIAEWGDITQLATAALIAKSHDAFTICLAAISALWCVTLIAVTLGKLMRNFVNPRLLQRVAAVAFVGVGFYMLWEVYRG